MAEIESVPDTIPQRRKSRTGVFVFGAFSGCLIAVVGFFFIAVMVAAVRGQSTEFVLGDKVAIVSIEGEIVEARETLETLHRYADNSMVKAIVMRIDSPGGTIAPTQEIYEEVRKIRRSKPVVASLSTVAASGGFYIASACDPIVANPGSITGSIGVILQWMEIKDLLAWAKMKPETITSGAMKAAGSPYLELTEAERAYLQRVTEQLHLQFIRAVADGRKGKMTEADVTRIADGRIFTGEEALSLKLIDRLGNLDDAVTIAAKMAGIHGKPATIYPRKRKVNILDLLTDTTDSKSVIDRVVSRGRASFLYRW
jgi:protease IV